MTLYEEIYHNMPKMPKFYRFEGFRSFPYHSEYGQLINMFNYIYFSATEEHHMYYVERRIRQLIREEILKDTDIKINTKTLLDPGAFNQIIRCIEDYPHEDKLFSIESSVSPIMIELLYKNSVRNQRKTVEDDRRIERVDSRKYGGGYGFCQEWLTVFNLLTVFNSHRRITTENIIDCLDGYRRNLIAVKRIIKPTSFLLDPKNLVINLNPKIYDDFSKYELMDALQKISEYQLYFPDSILATDTNEQIRRIIHEYVCQREHILELSDSIYNKHLTKTLTNKQ